MVRSVDRPLLDEALASIALQTWPNVEVVVIAAKPGHRPLPTRCGPFAMRLITTEAPLPRSTAANRALDEARGDYLLFLDDDDWLLPGHLARLAGVLQRQPQTLAAYTGVALANEKGEPLGQAMDLPFDAVRQLAGNLTPIHAVMFSRALLARGVRFDERLDLYEDWDFWLQLGRHTLFTHLPGVSACYRIHASSGVHDSQGPAGVQTQRIYDKWQPLWRPDERAAIMSRAWAAADLENALQAVRHEADALRGALAGQQALLASQQESIQRQQDSLAQQTATAQQQQATLAAQQTLIGQQLATLHQQADTVAHLRRQVDELDATVATRDADITALTRSTSWKVTAPLRRLSGAIRRRP